MSIDILDFIECTDFIAEEIDGTTYFRVIENVNCSYKDKSIKGTYILGRERLSFDFKEAEDGIIIRVLSDNEEGKEQKYSYREIANSPYLFDFIPGLRKHLFSYYRDLLKDKKIEMVNILDNLKSIKLVDKMERSAIMTYQVETLYANKPISGTLIFINPYYNYKDQVYIFISGDIYVKYVADEYTSDYHCWMNYVKQHPLLEYVLF